MRWWMMVFLVALPAPLAAQDCDEAVTTLEMGTCMQDALTAADGELNVSYQLAQSNLADGDFQDGDDIAAQLKSAQRAWIIYRDLACDAEAALYEGGSMAGIAKMDCLLRLTRERVTSLSEFLSD